MIKKKNILSLFLLSIVLILLSMISFSYRRYTKIGIPVTIDNRTYDMNYAYKI